ncbi:MAG: glycosyltransferase family 2 protein [Holosporaceae bacterium]|jgi:glycosyltransferase involved in cell wall biosynthesis|nr:glycosyltransferase family 2 protein [Holosporaceae bacterium]
MTNEAEKAEKKEVSIIVPFYNEGESVKAFFQAVIPILRRMEHSFQILCINDGSEDNTLERLLEMKKEHPEIKIIDFSRNFGKDAAITAGLDLSEGNCVIPMDCDLQDPPELLIDMIEKWNEEGVDVVLARRTDRSADPMIKRVTAELFYKIYNRLSDPKLPENVGDFRLMSRKVVDALKVFPERRRFMKGLFAFVGFSTAVVEYKRPGRNSGTSRWSYLKLWNYAVDGITSFSTFPLKVSTYLGLLVTALSMSRGIWILFRTMVFGVDIPGYASLIVAILFLGGIQLTCLGVIGEYVGRIYIESKQRPLYIIKEII